MDFIFVVKEAKEKLIKIKIESVLSKNKGYQTVLKISEILSGKEDTDRLPEYWSLNDLTCMKNCPITSVDAERLFSLYKHLLTSNRRSLKFENMKKIFNCLVQFQR
jgi:hypothetical protein